jgi:hypothetical protein
MIVSNAQPGCGLIANSRKLGKKKRRSEQSHLIVPDFDLLANRRESKKKQKKDKKPSRHLIAPDMPLAPRRD